MSTCRVLGRVLSAHCTAFRGLGRRRMLPEPRVLHQLAWCPAGLGQAGGPGPSEGSVCAAAQECAFHARGPGSDLRLAVRICFTPGVAAVASCLSLPQLVSVSGACRQSSSLGGKIRFGPHGRSLVERWAGVPWGAWPQAGWACCGLTLAAMQSGQAPNSVLGGEFLQTVQTVCPPAEGVPGPNVAALGSSDSSSVK